MINTSLEITESEYLIKLNRSKFNLSFIRSLLKIVEVSDRDDDDINEKDFDKAVVEKASYFTRIDEK